MNQTVKGTQAIFRALTLLRLIADAHPEGVSIATLTAQSGLDRSTIYRLASSLIEFGLVERDGSRRYHLGIESMQLGLAAMRSAPIVNRVRPIMLRLARRTEDTVFLVVRNGDYGHCLHCEEGTYPVKALVLRIGGMRVLGIGSASIALMATLPDEDIAALYQRHLDEFHPRGPTLGGLQRFIQSTRRLGYADTADLVTDGVCGVGMRFELPTGSQAAISVAAIRSRMTPDRRRWIAALIAEELTTDGLVPAMPRR